MNKLQEENLLALAEHMRTVSPVQFDMTSWVGDDWQGAPDLSCGTTACVVGHASTMPRFREQGLRLSHDCYPILVDSEEIKITVTSRQVIEPLFGKEAADARIFHDDSVLYNDVGGELIPSIVAERLLSFVKMVKEKTWRRQLGLFPYKPYGED